MKITVLQSHNHNYTYNSLYSFLYVMFKKNVNWKAKLPHTKFFVHVVVNILIEQLFKLTEL